MASITLTPTRFSAPVQGALYMSAAAAVFAVMVVLVRLATDELHPFEVAFLRNLFGLVLMVPWLLRSRLHGLQTRNFKLHTLRGITGLIAMLTWFMALALIPMGEAVALSFTAPLFATVGAAIVLHEVVRARRWTATLIGFLGVLLIVRPGVESLSLGAVLVLVSSMFGACSALIVKKLSGTDSPGTITTYMVIFLTPLSLLAALPFWQWPSLEVLAIMLGVGIFGTAGHIFYARAMSLADASAVVPYDYLRLPLVALIGFLAFGEVMDIWGWLGAGVIVVSTIYIAHREAVRNREEARRRAASAAVEAPPLPVAAGAQRHKY
ncbi:MAG: DMT family transporter [Azospirillaceae bacterium]